MNLLNVLQLTKNQMKANIGFYVGAFGLTLIYIIWLIGGENSFLIVHDNLDSEFVYIKLLFDSGNWLGLNIEEKVLGAMNGIERSFFRSGLNFTFLFFKIFSPLQAYIINSYFVHLIGYVGFYLLITTHWNFDKRISALFAFIFGLLSYYTMYGLSVAGQPLLLYSFLNVIKKQSSIKDWVIITLFPFYAYFIMTVPFYLPILLCIWIYYSTKERQLNLKFILGMGVFTLISIGIEFPLIYNQFFSGLVSHRMDWKNVYWTANSMDRSLEILRNKFLEGTHIHMGVINTYPAGFVILLMILFRVKPTKLQLLLFVTFSAITFFEAFFNFNLLPPALRAFNFSRFFVFTPFIIILFTAAVLNQLQLQAHFKRIFNFVAWALSLFSVCDSNQEIFKNISLILGKKINEPNYHSFFDAKLFDDIKKENPTLALHQSNVLCIGFYPNIAQFNGIYTLDSYQNNYNLSYKNNFYKIIESEIIKDTSNLYSYFKNYGSRCYSFSSEISYKTQYSKTDTNQIRNLNYNFHQAKIMNASHVISAVPILNYKALNLELLKLYKRDDAYRKLYVYKIL